MQYKWVALSVTSLGTLIVGLDARIVIVGIPTIAAQLGASAEQVIWVTQSYLFASTIALLLIGRVTDVIGRVKIYNMGFIVFTIGSALASISLSPLELILARVVQGTGSAMVIINSAAIITDAAPPNELGVFTGLNQVFLRVGGIMGLTLSGVVIALADWRALFYINIPIGIFGTIWSYLKLREISTKDEAKKIDWAGFITFSAGLGLVLLAITFLSYGIGADEISGLGLLALGLGLIIAFVFIERRTLTPILDLRLFKIGEFAAGNISQMLNAISLFGVQIIVSIYLQIGLGYSVLSAGLGLLPLEVLYAIFGVLTSRLSDVYGTKIFTITGLAISSVGVFFLTFFGSTTSYTEIGLVLSVVGIGNGLFVSPNVRAIFASVPPNRRGIASGFRVTLFNVGVTLSSGLAILLITFGIPSQEFNLLLQGLVSGPPLIAAREQFISGFRIAALMLALANTAALIPLLLISRKSTSKKLKPLAKPQED